ncbi:Phosphomannomutase/phosphoglucomutase [Porphyridium purpureum]|uniref:Phosphomannomutase/phosphoglucomutase n=1 Tax=Porphyridium purpureum TaxID=35688 RepID=A0A5J4Z1L0_PORPP|nr:Phosphomannomutase/phosphoglucomutase [Porphyridium purpureum]|eukprot:POR6483..scf208_2
MDHKPVCFVGGLPSVSIRRWDLGGDAYGRAVVEQTCALDAQYGRRGGALCRPCRMVRPPRVEMADASTARSASAAAVNMDAEFAALKALQNGSDMRGVAVKLAAEHEVNLTLERCAALGYAFVVQLARIKGKAPAELSVSIGRDSRITGDSIALAVASGALQAGVGKVLDVGLATTPAMFMSTITEGFMVDGAMMLTASHLPPERNGIKYFTAQGGASKAMISELVETAFDLISGQGPSLASSWESLDQARVQRSVDFLSVYADILVEKIRAGVNDADQYDKPLRDFHVIVDAGNGAGGFFATKVLQKLGADTSGSQYLEPDGTFPNHVPNPEDPDAMHATVRATLDNRADLGIVFDTDVDRSAVVAGHTGEEINRNKLIGLLSAIVLRETPGATIVTDSVTSLGLKKFIEARGGKHFRYKRGYKNVIDKALELNAQGVNTPLAIETSGHGAMNENYMLDDGAYLAVKILIEMVRLYRETGNKRAMGELLAEMEQPADEKEFRIKFKEEAKAHFSDHQKTILAAFETFCSNLDGWTAEAENYEGYRFTVAQADGDVGWVLLRSSLHDPLLAMNVESSMVNGCTEILDALKPFFEQFRKELDLSVLSI